MANNSIYRIKVLNWEKHNSKKKKGMPYIMLHYGFLSDAKIRQLTPAAKLLFLSCLLVAGESATSQFDVTHESLCYQSGVKSGSLQSQLNQLQSLQLLMWSKVTTNIIEIRELKEIKEDNLLLLESLRCEDSHDPPQYDRGKTDEEEDFLNDQIREAETFGEIVLPYEKANCAKKGKPIAFPELYARKYGDKLLQRKRDREEREQQIAEQQRRKKEQIAADHANGSDYETLKKTTGVPRLADLIGRENSTGELK